MRMVYMFVFHGVEGDIRSDDEEGDVTTADLHDKIDVGNGKSPAHGGLPNGKSKNKTA